MSRSQIKKRRREAGQAGRIDPELNRIRWHRKPQTQVVMNKKAEQRRTQCRRKGSREGADFFVLSDRERESDRRRVNQEPALAIPAA